MYVLGSCSVSSFLRILPEDILENALAMVSKSVCDISKYIVTRSMFKNVLCSVNVQCVHVLCERGSGLKQISFAVLVLGNDLRH